MNGKIENNLGAEAQQEECTKMEMSGELVRLCLHIIKYSILRRKR